MITLRFPKLLEGVPQRKFPPLGKDVRVGKNTLWLLYSAQLSWQERLVEILEVLIKSTSLRGQRQIRL